MGGGRAEGGAHRIVRAMRMKKKGSPFSSFSMKTLSPSQRFRLIMSPFGTHLSSPSVHWGSIGMPSLLISHLKSEDVKRNMISFSAKSELKVIMDLGSQEFRMNPVSSRTSLRRHSGTVSRGSVLPPTPIHLPLFMSCSFLVRWSIK